MGIEKGSTGNYIDIALAAIRGHLKMSYDLLQLSILATPSGDKRNHLCDANIHVTAALQSLMKARENLGGKNEG